MKGNCFPHNYYIQYFQKVNKNRYTSKEGYLVPVFKTIRQTAALGILPEYRLRQMVKQGKIPGIYSGTRFLINVTALIEQLNAESVGQANREY